MKKKSYTTFAAIHLGSEMISMQIVEYRNMNKVKVIEQCNHRVKLGEETFKNKIIPFSMVSAFKSFILIKVFSEIPFILSNPPRIKVWRSSRNYIALL